MFLSKSTWLHAVLLCACTSGGQSGTEAVDVTGSEKPDAATPNQESTPDAATPDKEPTPDAGRVPTPVTVSELDASTVKPTPTGSGGDAGDAGQGPTYEWELYLDFYKNTCSGYEGQVFCSRTSVDGQEFQINSDFQYADFEWGHRYHLAGHYADNAGVEDAPQRSFVTDVVLEDTTVPAGTRFELTIDPTLDDLGNPSQLDVPANRYFAGTIGENVDFFCTSTLCSALREALEESERFTVTFEFDDDLRIWAVLLDGDPWVPDVEAQIANWEALEPDSYVATVCGTGFTPPTCILEVVENGVVTFTTLTDQTDVDATPMPRELPELPALDLLADSVRDGSSMLDRFAYSIDADYGYVSEVLRGCDPTADYPCESSGQRVQCFAADTTDPAACDE